MTILPLDGDSIDGDSLDIVQWKGKIQCAIPGQPVAIRFKGLDAIRYESANKGDLEVTLERTRKNRNVHEVLVGIALKGGQSSSSMEGWTSLIDAYLEDPQGNLFWIGVESRREEGLPTSGKKHEPMRMNQLRNLLEFQSKIGWRIREG
jgi:hypothetical protein